MKSRKLQITVNRITEIGEIRDLGVSYDLVEIQHNGNIIQVSRSALIELLGPPQGGSRDLPPDTGPRNDGPQDAQPERPHPKPPATPNAMELDFEEDRDHESTYFEFGLNRESARQAPIKPH